MGLFKSKAEKEAEKKLDGIIQRLEMNMANNYKDNAQDNLKELEAALDAIRTEGNLKESFIAKYESMLEGFRIEMKGYSHKDQKPYWH
ncbi:MAG: hypothetical protein K6G57_03695 [Lachnospiraceae bacterium]|nr:hypothetical protein [Lachnospiraceae bacterium]